MKFRNQFSGLEHRLRAERAEPSDELQRAVSELTAWRPSARSHRPIRLAAAAALTLTLMVTAAALGTSSFAGNLKGAGGASAASQYGQYGEKVIICHRPGKKTTGVTLRLSPEGAKAHLREHAGDTAGPCP